MVVRVTAFIASIIFLQSALQTQLSIISFIHPSKYFNVGSTLFLGPCDVATSHNVKSALEQRYVRQRWNYNAEQRWNNVVFFKVESNNVRQRRNNFVIFNVDFHNVGQRQNSFANKTIWKKKKKASIQKRNNIFELQRICWTQIFFIFSPF